MVMHIVYVPKKPFSFDQLDNLFGEIVSVLRYLIPISLGIITFLIYVSVIPLSIVAIVFAFINKKFNKRLPARSLMISSVICWLWLFVFVLLGTMLPR